MLTATLWDIAHQYVLRNVGIMEPWRKSISELLENALCRNCDYITTSYNYDGTETELQYNYSTT
jgi:hypothetical protein